MALALEKIFLILGMIRISFSTFGTRKNLRIRFLTELDTKKTFSIAITLACPFLLFLYIIFNYLRMKKRQAD